VADETEDGNDDGDELREEGPEVAGQRTVDSSSLKVPVTEETEEEEDGFVGSFDRLKVFGSSVEVGFLAPNRSISCA
jgi:hypothetical protein